MSTFSCSIKPHGLVDGDVGLALGVGVHRLDLIALDAALL